MNVIVTDKKYISERPVNNTLLVVQDCPSGNPSWRLPKGLYFSYRNRWVNVTNIIAVSAVWGSITGTITDQLDLVNYISSQGFITNVITALGYTPENVANKAIDFSTINDTLYPTTEAVEERIETKVGVSIFKTGGNQATTSDTAQDITELSISVSANTRYRIFGFIRFSVNNTGGTKFAVTVPSGSVDVAIFGVSSTTTTFTRALLTSSGTLSVTSFLNTNSTNGWVFVVGEVSIGVTGGTLQFQFASGTATQTSTIFQLGTDIEVKPLT